MRRTQNIAGHGARKHHVADIVTFTPGQPRVFKPRIRLSHCPLPRHCAPLAASPMSTTKRQIASCHCQRRASRPCCVDALAWPLHGRGHLEWRANMRGLAAFGLGIIALAVPTGAHAQSVADFYKGKNVTVIVGYTAGGGYDLYARALARHMGKHLPAAPNSIVQKITVAGSLNAANNIYNVTAKDGTGFGTFRRGPAMETC